MTTRPAVSLNASYRYCRRLARRTGRNFYFSFLTLPRKQFRAMCSLYAFMRVCDDLGDDPAASVEERARRLRNWRGQLDAALEVGCRMSEVGDQRSEVGDRRPEVGGRSEPPKSANAVLGTQYSVLSTEFTACDATHHSPLTTHHSPLTTHQPHSAVYPALVDTVQTHAIPPRLLHDVIDGVEADLRPRGFETFDELNRYCYQVAGAVGVCCVHIWGFKDERAFPPAVDCGTAFQLTNILRDLGEDAAMGRCYLPREDLRRFEVTAADIAAGRRDDRFRELMRFEVRRARDYYQRARELFPLIHRPGRPILAAMLKIYGGLLEEIERRDYDVFTKRVSLSGWRKLRIAFGAILRHRVFGR